MRLRDAVLADLDQLLDVQETGAVRGLSHIFPQSSHPFPRDEVRRRWAAEVGDPSVATYVVEDDSGQIAGFAATRNGEFLHFGIATDKWGSGLAAKAHDAIIERLAAAGVTRVWLRVFEENRRARRFYEKLGWRQTGRRSRTSFPPRPVLVEYELDLSRNAQTAHRQAR